MKHPYEMMQEEVQCFSAYRRSTEYVSPLELLESPEVTRVCAPMVRYSKLPFRDLVRKYDCDLTYTPMIVSDSFIKSKEARNIEFITNKGDHPLIVQFAAANQNEFADATELVYPYVDGVGLNCGCPQRWAMAEGYGANLIKHPELINDMVKQTKQRVNDPQFPVSIKIRIHKDLRQTVEMCQRAEKVGAAWIDVHGRTADQRKEPVDYEAIKLIKSATSIPVIANGDIKSQDDVEMVAEITGANGLMAAQGMLNNPAMFSGYKITPKCCVEDWLDISLKLGTPFILFHHHLMFMTDKWHTKSERQVFNNLSSVAAVLEYLRINYNINMANRL